MRKYAVWTLIAALFAWLSMPVLFAEDAKKAVSAETTVKADAKTKTTDAAGTVTKAAATAKDEAVDEADEDLDDEGLDDEDWDDYTDEEGDDLTLDEDATVAAKTAATNVPAPPTGVDQEATR